MCYAQVRMAKSVKRTAVDPQKVELTEKNLWHYVDRPQMLDLLKAYYTGELKKSDNRAYTWPDKAIPMPHVNPKGKHLIIDIGCDELQRVVMHLRSMTEEVGGMQVQGWHEYVLRVLMKLEKPWVKQNEMMPRVRDDHFKTSLNVAGKAFFRLVLSKTQLANE